MSAKRTRTTCEPENEVEMRPVEISSSVRAKNTVVSRPRMIRVPPTPPPSPQPQKPPLQIKITEGGGFRILPPTFLDWCNCCRKTIGSNEDRYMNGGLEAYCSPSCRENFNNMMEENVELSHDSELPSMDHIDPIEEEEEEPIDRSRN